MLLPNTGGGSGAAPSLPLGITIFGVGLALAGAAWLSLRRGARRA